MTQEIDWDALFVAAEQARQKAHAPYSQFFVGAALLLEDGSVAQGCNVENASYGLSVCAERHAVAAAVLKGSSRPRALALVVDAKEPVTPCGACRQVLAEVAMPSLPVRTRNLGGRETLLTLGELLPSAFGPDRLKDR